MNALGVHDTVATWVTERPGRTRLFGRLGIDFCCGGQKPLAEACAEKGLDANTVVQILQALEATAGADAGRDWTRAGLTELCDHIEAVHHRYLREEMPRISGLTRKVAAVHGERHAELVELAQVYAELLSELTSHMQKEERVLFPAIRQLEAAAGRPSGIPAGALANPIRAMIFEHEAAGGHLARMHELTGGYQPPADACGSYHALLDGLQTLETDLHEHIHKENNILFPRAEAMAAGQ